ncbi:hypothetical protein [Nitrococcus mobilis]|uniref:Uncharacterized protein n=1 Tax=Nitrococcus mobilis Nb-231 TaxID=314278 RepID=A4BVC2_9GAMM|nr:hypothetical protein [Nitrococcus mobilis]EAR20307.1 hypothetical protein NB231_02905 [Nitrococcus mobilis Nb-231]
MRLLDAVLAFSLTIAILATVVTTLIEGMLRAARLRKKNLVEVVKRLNDELKMGPLNLSPAERRKFAVSVIQNPLKTSVRERAKHANDASIEHYLQSTGRASTRGKPILRRVALTLAHLFWDPQRGPLYDKVSLEHVLRRLADTESVQRICREASEFAQTELNRLARKYEELVSAVSANFKRDTQLWSIAVGVLLAVGANIDGVRLLETYARDGNLAATLIERQDQLSSGQAYRDAAVAAPGTTEVHSATAPGDSDLGVGDPIPPGISAGSQPRNQENSGTGPQLGPFPQEVFRAHRQIIDLIALGIPIGWDLYPACGYRAPATHQSTTPIADDPYCQKLAAAQKTPPLATASIGKRIGYTAANDPIGVLQWFVKVIVTGLLIGLGAPFWFDVAKRLAQIRQAGNFENAAAEVRMSGKDANGDPAVRNRIVRAVVADAVATEHPVEPPLTSKP